MRDGAKAEIVNVQRLSSKTWLFASCHARVERDAELDWVEGGFGSARGKVWIQNDLAGRGATSRVTGAYFADRSQHLDYDTYQLHAAPDTTSDFAFKGALRDTAATVWRGMIRVEEGAQKTNAYQENRNLLLSKTATANSIPGLEILANDVRCTHGATLSQVDREQLFYLMARGLPRAEAERLIVRGFFQDVLDRIELQPVRDALGAALEARIPRRLSSREPGGRQESDSCRWHRLASAGRIRYRARSAQPRLPLCASSADPKRAGPMAAWLKSALHREARDDHHGTVAHEPRHRRDARLPHQGLAPARTASRSCVEASGSRTGAVAAAHVHPAQEERFEVLAGELEFRLGKTTLVAKPGDRSLVPAGTPHRFRERGRRRRRISSARSAGARVRAADRDDGRLAEDRRGVEPQGDAEPAPARGDRASITSTHVRLPFPPRLAAEARARDAVAPLGRLLGFKRSSQASQAPTALGV